MVELNFKLNVSIDDRTGKPRAAYLQVRNGEVAETRELESGRVFADYSSDGLLLGIEFLGLTTFSWLPFRTFEVTTPSHVVDRRV